MGVLQFVVGGTFKVHVETEVQRHAIEKVSHFVSRYTVQRFQELYHKAVMFPGRNYIVSGGPNFLCSMVIRGC